MSVPVGKDILVWNAHRVYGRLRLPLLLEGWETVHTFGFSEELLSVAQALNVGFLHEPPILTSVESFRSEIDEFHVHGREVYWLCRGKQNESKFVSKPFERAIKGAVTFRSTKTVARLAAKYGKEH